MMKGFTVIEIVKSVPQLTVIASAKALRFTKGCAEVLEFAPAVRFLIDSGSKRFAVQACKENDPQSVRFSKPKEEQGDKAVVCQNLVLMEILSKHIAGWGETPSIEMKGTYSKADKAIIFDMAAAEPYKRFTITK